MLTSEEIKNTVVDHVNHLQFINTEGDKLQINEDLTIDKPSFKIFFYNSKKYIETGDMLFAVGGNSPIFISKLDGKISKFRTGLTLEEMISEYDQREL